MVKSFVKMLKISIIPVIIFILRFPISLSRADTGNNSFHNPFQVRIRFNERPEFRIFSRLTFLVKARDISFISSRMMFPTISKVTSKMNALLAETEAGTINHG